MARTAPRSSTSPDVRPTDIAAKAAAAASRIAGLKADLAHAHELVHQAQVREALTRTELTLALSEALKARDAAARALRVQLARRHFETAPRAAPRARTAFDRGLERLLLKGGAAGQARVIARAGVWRGDPARIGAYVRRGPDPAVQPDALFDQAWYLGAYPEAAASKLSPLAHYLQRGAAQGFSPHPLFHATAYSTQNASALATARVTPLEHFMREGASLGRNPHPAFDIAHYVGQGPTLAQGEDPVSHYLREGWRQGLSPHPLFDARWYRAQMPPQAAETPPLVHYLAGGWREGLSPHPLFDPDWYVKQHPDVAEAGTEPLTHFLLGGAAEGRSPSPWFDTGHYLAQRGEALEPGANPLVDYLQGGAWAVAESRPGFPNAAYLAATPELVADGMTPLEHWARKSARR